MFLLPKTRAAAVALVQWDFPSIATAPTAIVDTTRVLTLTSCTAAELDAFCDAVESMQSNPKRKGRCGVLC